MAKDRTKPQPLDADDLRKLLGKALQKAGLSSANKIGKLCHWSPAALADDLSKHLLEVLTETFGEVHVTAR